MHHESTNDFTKSVNLPAQEDYPSVPLWALLFFSGYVIVWYLQVGERIDALGAIRIEFIYAALATCVAILLIGNIEINSPLNGYLIAYLVVLLIQVPLSRDFDASWNIFINRIVKFAFLGFFIVAFVKSPRGLRFFLVAFLMACMKIGQEGFYGKITGGMMWQNQGVMRLHGTTSLYGHPNSLSGNALGTLPFVFCFFPLSRRFVKCALVVLAVFAVTIVLYSGSRTGYVGIIVFLFAIVAWSKNRIKAMLFLTIICLGIIPMIPQQYVDRFYSIFTQKEAEGSSSEARIVILKDAWEVFLENPLGIGVAAFPKVRRERFGRSQDTHNLYLEVATNLGIQGFVVFALLVSQLLRTLKRLERTFSDQLQSIRSINECPMADDHCKDLALLHATAKAVFLFVIIRLCLGLFGMDLYEIYWWFAIGLTIALWNINRYSSEISERLLVESQASDCSL